MAFATVDVGGSKNVARTMLVSHATLNPLDKVPKGHPLLDVVGGGASLHKLKTLGKDLVALVAHQIVKGFSLTVLKRTDSRCSQIVTGFPHQLGPEAKKRQHETLLIALVPAFVFQAATSDLRFKDAHNFAHPS